MVEVADLFIKILKDELSEALSNQSITFDQVHFVVRRAVSELSKNSKYKEQTKKYYEVEQDLKAKILEKNKELMELRKQLASNDEKMYEAIKAL